MNNKSSTQYNKMLNTPIPRLVIGLSIPTVASMMVTNIYNIVDSAFVGKISTSASGAVGIVFGFMSILQAIGFTFGQGAGSIISRKLGGKKYEDANIITSTAIVYAFVLAIFASILCYIFVNPLIILLGSTKTIAPYAKTYVTFILATGPFMVTGFTLNNILRFEGKAFFGMIGLMSGAVLNILGDIIFMFGLNMGIAGAGLSTAISQVVSFCILFAAILAGKTQSKFSFKYVTFDKNKIADIVGTGLPSLLRQGLNSLTTIELNNIAKGYGDPAVAAMSIVSRLFFFIFSVAVGVGQGFQPISGFSYGAKKYDRLKKAYKFTLTLSEILMVIGGGTVFIFAPQLTRMLRNDDMVVEIASRALRLQCIAVLFLPLCMVTEMLMQSTGKKAVASALAMLRNGLLFIPTLWILEKLRGLAGIQEAQPLAYILVFPIAIYFAKAFFDKIPTEKNIQG